MGFVLLMLFVPFIGISLALLLGCTGPVRRSVFFGLVLGAPVAWLLPWGMTDSQHSMDHELTTLRLCSYLFAAAALFALDRLVVLLRVPAARWR